MPIQLVGGYLAHLKNVQNTRICVLTRVLTAVSSVQARETAKEREGHRERRQK